MALKPRVKRRIFLAAITLIAVVLCAVAIVPQWMNLNALKPKLEAAITRQTGVPTTIRGDVHFSLLFRATIVAHDIVIPDGTVGRVMLSLPLRDMFNLERAPLDGQITISGARVTAARLDPVDFRHRLQITDSTVRFLDKDYDIVRGTFDGGRFSGTVRTNQHKYDIEFENDEFLVRNKNNNLEIRGQLYSDGTARGEMSITTDNINRWFDFAEPRINRRIDLTMNFDWDGGYGFDFTNIVGNGFTGEIKLSPDGARNIKLKAADIDFDFSFLMNPVQLFKNTVFDLDFYGNLKIGNLKFSHLKLNAAGLENMIQIGTVVADDIAMTGGYIDASGAHDIMITLPIDNVPASCLFSGSPDKWSCGEFAWGAIHGAINVDGDAFSVQLASDMNMPDVKALRANARRLGTNGVISFRFADVAGSITVDNDDMRSTFSYAKNKTLLWADINLPFLPNYMQYVPGDFTRADNITTFRPTDNSWQVVINNNGEFMIAGNDFKDWIRDIDLQALRPLPYAIAGRFASGAVTDLRIEIADQSFTGRFVDGVLTLHTPLLNIDAITSQEYVDNYEELSFTTQHPILIPFGLGVDVSMSADRVVYNGDEYANFIYSLKRDVQTFSVTDDARGDITATLSRDGVKYDAFVQLNRFKIAGDFLAHSMPLNISDTRITAEIALKTSGQIAHDIIYNLSGVMDMAFDGGYITGLGIDDFYASAENITRLNAKDALAVAFDGGKTRIKRLTIAGKYAKGVFDTTSPLTLTMAHTDAVGQIQIADGTIAARLRLVMRGTSPDPQPVDIEILGNGTRNYSFTEIMRDFDPAYLRGFIKTHNRF